MNIAIILAGGTGSRMGSNIPKQFIEVQNKPILAYTLEIFEQNKNIDAIEIVCHKEWENRIEEICQKYCIKKKRWLCIGGKTFQESVMKGVFNLKDKISREDIVVISFGVSPMTPQEDIDESIRICQIHGNAIAAVDIDLCTCIKDDEFSTTQNIVRETIKGFANPWTFKFGELCDAYEEAVEKNILKEIEPHTTSLYFALGKRLWFSKSTSAQCKITHKNDLDLFEGYLLLKRAKDKSIIGSEKINDNI